MGGEGELVLPGMQEEKKKREEKPREGEKRKGKGSRPERENVASILKVTLGHTHGNTHGLIWANQAGENPHTIAVRSE